MADHEKLDLKTQIFGSRRAYKPSSQLGRLKNGAQKASIETITDTDQKGPSRDK